MVIARPMSKQSFAYTTSTSYNGNYVTESLLLCEILPQISRDYIKGRRYYILYIKEKSVCFVAMDDHWNEIDQSDRYRK